MKRTRMRPPGSSTGKGSRPRLAGPLSRSPPGVNALLWHGRRKSPDPASSLIWQPRCGHSPVRATTRPFASRLSRTLPTTTRSRMCGDSVDPCSRGSGAPGEPVDQHASNRACVLEMREVAGVQKEVLAGIVRGVVEELALSGWLQLVVASLDEEQRLVQRGDGGGAIPVLEQGPVGRYGESPCAGDQGVVFDRRDPRLIRDELIVRVEVIDAEAQRYEERGSLRDREEHAPRSGEQEVGDPCRAVGGDDAAHTVVLGSCQDAYHRSEAVAEEVDRPGVVPADEVNRAACVGDKFGKGPRPSRSAAPPVSSIVEAQAVDARSEERRV